MTSDYSKPHRGVAYFGLWASETADDYGKRSAATVLARAVDMCVDEDMRHDREVCSALAYLEQQGEGKRVRLFRKALDVQHPDERREAAAKALASITQSLGRSFGQTPARL